VTISTSSAIRDYTLSFDDNMSTAFNIDRSSFKCITELIPAVHGQNFQDIDNYKYYALSDGTNSSVTSVGKLTEANAAQYGYSASDTQLIGKDVVAKSADVYTYLIASRPSSGS
jgi:hypothetical protein